MNKWVLYELDNNACFWNNSQLLNLIELSPLISTGNYTIEFVASDTGADIFGFSNDSGYGYDFLMESMYANQLQLKKWYQRVLEVPILIGTDGSAYFFNEDTVWLEEHGYRYMKKSEFVKTFYLQK